MKRWIWLIALVSAAACKEHEAEKEPSAVVSAQITLDVTAPSMTGVTMTLSSPTNNGYTNTVNIGVRVPPPS